MRETLLRALREGDVRFVLIGGAALQSHGQRYETADIDVTPDRAEQNLARLAGRMRTGFDARLVDVEGGLCPAWSDALRWRSLGVVRGLSLV